VDNRTVERGLTAPPPLQSGIRVAGTPSLRRGVSLGQFLDQTAAACQPKWLAKQGEKPNARNHYFAVSDVQEQELLNHEEQEDDHGPSGVLEVLQYLPQAHGPQRDEVVFTAGRA
jgi:hypothetical protein